MNGLAVSVADRGPDSLSIAVRPYFTSVRAITVNRKVARLLNVGSEACAR